MTQATIKILLQELANNKTNRQRIQEIREDLAREAPLREVVTSLFDDVAKNRREMFPQLFPVFAALCGGTGLVGREQVYVRKIDWKLVD